jgi:hypothetical protein
MRDFTHEERMEMKEDFIALLRRIKRPNANIEGLIDKLETTDFFTAPASTRYHNACYGGLLAHSLNVYNNLEMLVKMKGLEEVIHEESIIICGLLHDLAKMNFYEPSVRNKKVYSEDGSKYDELGKFDWVSERAWSVRPVEQRFIYGSHEETSEFMARCYIPLKIDESIAILHHHSGMSNDSTVKNISDFYVRYPVAHLLHLADMLATYLDEEFTNE